MRSLKTQNFTSVSERRPGCAAAAGGEVDVTLAVDVDSCRSADGFPWADVDGGSASELTCTDGDRDCKTCQTQFISLGFKSRGYTAPKKSVH